jgi:hypothetical protein
MTKGSNAEALEPLVYGTFIVAGAGFEPAASGYERDGVHGDDGMDIEKTLWGKGTSCRHVLPGMARGVGFRVISGS